MARPSSALQAPEHRTKRGALQQAQSARAAALSPLWGASRALADTARGGNDDCRAALTLGGAPLSFVSQEHVGKRIAIHTQPVLGVRGAGKAN